MVLQGVAVCCSMLQRVTTLSTIHQTLLPTASWTHLPAPFVTHTRAHLSESKRGTPCSSIRIRGSKVPSVNPGNPTAARQWCRGRAGKFVKVSSIVILQSAWSNGLGFQNFNLLGAARDDGRKIPPDREWGRTTPPPPVCELRVVAWQQCWVTLRNRRACVLRALWWAWRCAKSRDFPSCRPPTRWSRTLESWVFLGDSAHAPVCVYICGLWIYVIIPTKMWSNTQIMGVPWRLSPRLCVYIYMWFMDM